MSNITDTQRIILTAASERLDGNIEPLPQNINKGIKQKVINGLLNRELITKQDNHYTINERGFEAIGITPPPHTSEKKPSRQGTKKSQVIELMSRSQGASNNEIQQLTQWKAHTVRGTIANLKKQFTIVAKKVDEELRYFIEIQKDDQDPK